MVASTLSLPSSVSTEPNNPNSPRVYTRADSMTKAYEECEHLIKTSVISFVKKHRVDYDEALRDAYWGFIYAYEHYDEEKGDFGSKVCAEVRFAMIDGLRERAKQNKRFPSVYIEVENLMQKRDFNLREFLLELSEDSQTLIETFLSLRPKSVRPLPYRKKLYRALGEMGWTAARVIESLREIREALLA